MGSFLEVRWSGAKEGKATLHLVPDTSVRFGTSTESEWSIPEGGKFGLKDTHFSIKLTNDELCIHDETSGNLTFINGKPCGSADCTILNGDVVTTGKLKFEFRALIDKDEFESLAKGSVSGERLALMIFSQVLQDDVIACIGFLCKYHPDTARKIIPIYERVAIIRSHARKVKMTELILKEITKSRPE